MDISEKRNFDRFVVDGTLTLRDNSSNVLEFTLDSISFGGCAIFSKEKIESGRIIDFDLEVLGEFLTGKAKVRSIREPKTFRATLYIIGLEFVEVNKDMVTYIIKKIQAGIVNKKKDAKIRKSLDIFPY